MGSKKQQIKEATTEGGVKVGGAIETGVFPAEVLELLCRVGTKQGGAQVRCKILAGHDEGKVMRRNVFGPVRIGDILMLRDTEIEAAPIRTRRGQTG